MFNWIKNNQVSVILFSVALSLIGFLVFAGGCQLEKVVQTDIPRSIAKDMGVPIKMSLREAYSLFEKWKVKTQTDGQDFVKNLEDSEEVLAFIESMINLGINEASGPLALLPGGGLAVTALTGFGALFIRKPGTAKEIATEKMSSYNKGRSTLIDELRALGVKLPENINA